MSVGQALTRSRRPPSIRGLETSFARSVQKPMLNMERPSEFSRLTAALICCNDPAGVLIADRGWTLDDRPTGLFEEVRMPDATLELFHAPFPDRTPLFLEIDSHVGWYAGASWSKAGIGKACFTGTTMKLTLQRTRTTTSLGARGFGALAGKVTLARFQFSRRV